MVYSIFRNYWRNYGAALTKGNQQKKKKEEKKEKKERENREKRAEKEGAVKK